MRMTWIGYNYDRTVYYRARYYDPQIGRFISEDPIRFWGGVDFYRYGANSPANTTDPSGKAQIWGNWCGGDWTGAMEEQYDPSHDHMVCSIDFQGKKICTPYYAPPIDALDGACRRHDILYWQCRQTYKCDRDKRIACFTAADRWLADAASHSAPNNWRESMAESAIEGYMSHSDPWYQAGDDDPSCGCKAKSPAVPTLQELQSTD